MYATDKMGHCLIAVFAALFALVSCDSEPPPLQEEDEVSLADQVAADELLSSAEPNLALLKGIEVVPKKLEMGVQEIQTARVIAFYLYDRNEDVTRYTSFEAEDTAIIQVERVSQDFVSRGQTVESSYFRLKALQPGKTKIVVTWGSQVRKEIEVVVADKTLEKIEVILNAKVHYLKYVEGVVHPVPITFKVFGVYSDASMKAIRSDDDDLQVTLSNENITTLDADSGLLMATAAGKGDLIFKYHHLSHTVPLEVSREENSVISLTATPDGIAVPLGLQQGVKVEALLKDKTSDLVQFDEMEVKSKPTQVDVHFAQEQQQIQFKGQQTGDFNVVFAYRGLQLPVRVVVFEADKHALEIRPASTAAVSLGESLQFRALLSLSDGSQLDVSSQCQWSSGAAKFTFDNAGLEVGVGAAAAVGTDEVKAEFAGMVATYTIQVEPKKLVGLEQRLAHTSENSSGGFVHGLSAVFNLFGVFSTQEVERLEDSYLTQSGWSCVVDAEVIDTGALGVTTMASAPTSMVVKQVTASAVGSVRLISTCSHVSSGEVVQVSDVFEVAEAIPLRLIIESASVVESLDPDLAVIALGVNTTKPIFAFMEYSDGSAVNVTASDKLFWNYENPTDGNLLGYVKQDGTLVARATAGTFAIDAHFEDENGKAHADSLVVRVE